MAELTPKTDEADLLKRVLQDIQPEQISELLESLLAATVRGRDGTEGPDNKVRLEALRLALAYGIGTPVQRQHVIEEKRHQSMDELMDDWRRTPSLFLASERELREARRTLEAEGVIEPE